MSSQWVQPRSEGAGQATKDGNRDTREDLRRASQGQLGVYEAFQTLKQSHEDQARAAADLLERETWAAAGVIEASGAIWSHLPGPTLRFALETPDDSEECRVELGRFSHLAALDEPSVGEQTLITAATPCFARVLSSQERRAAGRAGALAYSYVPISVAEAVTMLGFAKIVAEIEAATRRAGQVLLIEAEAQSGRQEQLLRIERMLGWEPDPAAATVAGAPPFRTRLAMMLVGQGDRRWLVPGTAGLGLVGVLSCVLLAIPFLVTVLIVIATVLLIWRLTSSLGA